MSRLSDRVKKFEDYLKNGSVFKVAEKDEGFGEIKPPRWRLVKFERLILPEVRYCTRCGRPITNVYWLLDTEKSMDIKDAQPFGSECVKIVTGKNAVELKREWSEYEAKKLEDLELKKRLGEVREWQLANKDLIERLERVVSSDEHHIPVLFDLYENILNTGVLTDKQLKFVKDLLSKADTVVSFTEWMYLLDIITLLIAYGKIDRYSAKVLLDVKQRAVDYGITQKQKDMLLDIFKKYKHQLSEIAKKERITDAEKEALKYFGLLD